MIPVELLISSRTDWVSTPLGKDALTQLAFELPAVIVPPLTLGTPPVRPLPVLTEAVGADRAAPSPRASVFFTAGFAVLAEELGTAAVVFDPGITETPEASGPAVAMSACGNAVDLGLAPGVAIRSTAASRPPRIPAEASSQRRSARDPAIRRFTSLALPLRADFTGGWAGVFVVI
jgi:hypothetical protein